MQSMLPSNIIVNSTLELIDIVVESLMTIQNPRYYQSERGFQAELYSEIRCHLKGRGFLESGLTIEQEYQKVLSAHGLNIRPDIIIHSPTMPGQSRKNHNFAVFELKLSANVKKAKEDFENLLKVMKALNYPVGFFINISSSKNHIDVCPDFDYGEIIAIAVNIGQSPIIGNKIGRLFTS